MRYSGLLLTLMVAVLLTGCAQGTLREAPAPLPPEEERPELMRMDIDWWHILVDFNTRAPFHRIAPTLTEQGILTASPLGELVLLSEEGRFIWRRQVTDHITAPVGADARNLFVMTGDGDLLMLDWEGQQRWSTALTAIATEAPLVLSDRIIVQTVDGRVTAIERNTGRALWVFQDAEPSLTITGTAKPVRVDDLVVTGLANGKLIALNINDGATVWEYRIGRAQGKTDVSRLVDVDAAVTVVDGLILATGYQGDLMVIEARSGRVLGAKALSSHRSVTVGEQYWFVVNADSHVLALDPNTLDEVWRQEQFTFRRLSEAVVWRDTLAVADGKGFVHLLDQESGEWLVTRSVDWTGISTAPIVVGDYLIQQGNSSRIKRLSHRPYRFPIR
ncbi:MAG: outer membrane protein assembly factor BamB [Saccharospirillum sp.]|nr:outer membrane protein assembly factor BamB [Saccharospirillum sp.]